MKEQQFKERWSELHGGADTEGVVGGWLSFSYQAARVCVALRITPNLLTFLGLGTAIAMGLSEYAQLLRYFFLSSHSSSMESMAALRFFVALKVNGASSLIPSPIASLKLSGSIWVGV